MGCLCAKNKKTADNEKSNATFQELNYNESNEHNKNIQKEEFKKNSYINKAEKNDEIKQNSIKQEKECKNIEEEEDIYKYIKEKNESNENNYYQVKNIEKKYIKLENEIQQLCLDKKCEEDDNDEDDKKFENFLINIKHISENALNLAKILKRALFKEFKKNNNNLVNLNINKDNQVEQSYINEFSSWCKNNIKDEDNLVQEYCKKYKSGNYNKEDFDLFVKLTTVYLECELCNEIIEYKTCDNECDFNNKKMYDLAEVRGVNKKVKFYILPGLFYNGDFFQNGKIHVFAYSLKGK